MSTPGPTAPPDTAAKVRTFSPACRSVIIECELGSAAIVSDLIAHWEKTFGEALLPSRFSFQRNNHEVVISAKYHNWHIRRSVSLLLLGAAIAPLDILREATETTAIQLLGSVRR